MNIKEDIMKTMIELVSVPGISGTESESLTSNKIYEMISNFSYFKLHPENLKLIKVENDPLNRYIVSALFCSKNKSSKTIVLNGHFDVVGIDEFGHLKDIAFNAVEVTKRINELPLYDDALNDLESGDYIFGRGTADMKFGIALNMEILRVLSERDDFKGNILFLAVPGEESNSEGMLGSVPHLVELQEKMGLDYVGALVSECCIPKKPQDPERYVYIGTVGKVMPLFFFAGKESHVCEPFNSLNPNLLASEVNRLFEYNTDFCDTSLGEVSPPPVCLKQTDLKEIYSVQLPLYAVSYYNLLTLNMSIEKVIQKLKNLCTTAFENALNTLNKNRARYEEISNIKNSSSLIKPCVITYDELYKSVKSIYGEEFDNYIENMVKECQKQKLDNQTIAIKIIKETYEKYPNKTPSIIIGFAPPYYPDKKLSCDNEKDMTFLDAIDKTISLAKNKHNVVLKKDNYFMGLCDLSYTGLSDVNSENIDKVSSNMLSNTNYSLPVDTLKKINIPGAVLGGLGKDFHKYTERLNISYSFDVVPDLYENIIYTLLK